MRIGELAKRAGVNASRIRFYEARALLPPAPRLANGYRDYGDETLQVLRFVDRARGLGFTLREIAAHLRSPADGTRKARLQARLEAKLLELDRHLEEARVRRATLAELVDEVRRARAGGA